MENLGTHIQGTLDAFALKELEGRFIFEKFLTDIQVQDITFSDQPYDTWDVAYTVDDIRVVTEIKYRNYPSTAFTTWLLEEHKYKFLSSMYNHISKDGLRCVGQYANIYSDGVILTWNITPELSSQLYSTIEYHNATTAVKREKVAKTVIHLPTIQAIKFKI